MNENLKNLKELCSGLNEEKIEINGDKYNTDDLIKLAQNYDSSIVSIHDALKIIKNLRLYDEMKRMFVQKDPNRFTNDINYNNVADKVDNQIKKKAQNMHLGTM